MANADSNCAADGCGPGPEPSASAPFSTPPNSANTKPIAPNRSTIYTPTPRLSLTRNTLTRKQATSANTVCLVTQPVAVTPGCACFRAQPARS